jgi:hypothetical protein
LLGDALRQAITAVEAFRSGRRSSAEPGGGGDGGGLPYDLGFVHVKAVDEAGHDRNTALKLRCASSLQAPKR